MFNSALKQKSVHICTLTKFPRQFQGLCFVAGRILKFQVNYKTRLAFSVAKQHFPTPGPAIVFYRETCFSWVPLFFFARWRWASPPRCPAPTCCGLWMRWMSIICWENGCWLQAAWAVRRTRRGSDRETPPTSSSWTTPLDFPFTVISASGRPARKSTPTSRWTAAPSVSTTSTTPSPSCGRPAQTVWWRTLTWPRMTGCACTCSAEGGRSSRRNLRNSLLSQNVSACFRPSWWIQPRSSVHTQSESQRKWRRRWGGWHARTLTSGKYWWIGTRCLFCKLHVVPFWCRNKIIWGKIIKCEPNSYINKT